MNHNKITSNPALKDHKQMELNEEWNNFMKRIGEVSTLVKDLASGDKVKSDAAKVIADQYLEGKVILDEDIKMTIKENRTVINQKAFKTLEKNDTVSKKIKEQFIIQRTMCFVFA